MKSTLLPKLVVMLAVLFAATSANSQSTNSQEFHYLTVENHRDADITAVFSAWVNATSFGPTHLAPGQIIPANSTEWIRIYSRDSSHRGIWCIHDIRLEFSDHSHLNLVGFNYCDRSRLVVN